jgi:hypothetical protein
VKDSIGLKNIFGASFEVRRGLRHAYMSTKIENNGQNWSSMAQFDTGMERGFTCSDEPECGTILDCGATAHVWTCVENKEKCHVPLQGEHTTKIIRTRGTVGGLTRVLENPDSPANLVSLQRLKEDGPWNKFIFEENFVVGIRETGRQDVIAICDPVTGLYRCTPIVTADDFSMEHANVAVGSTNDIHETNVTDNIMRRLGLPSPEMVRRMIKNGTIRKLGVSKEDLKRYRNQSNESRMFGSQTVPRYIMKKKEVPNVAKHKLGYLEELYGDSKKLRHPGPRGEKWAFAIVDRATGTVWVVLHKDFTSLPQLVEKQVLSILDDARRTLKISEPKIHRFYLDGHPTQMGRFEGDIAPLEGKLSHHGIFCPGVPPGDHQRMGLVEVAHKMLDRIAVTMFHEQGAALPEECFAYAYEHAAKVKDMHAQRLRNNKSAFELRTGRKPVKSDIPYPAIFASATIKDMDKTGGKQGSDHLGVVVNTGRNAPAGKQCMKIWVPKTNETVWRTGVVINERFSSFGPDRINRMRSGGVVHKITDISTRVHTRAVVHEASKINMKKIIDQKSDNGFYYYATRHGTPLMRPYVCGSHGCKNSVPEMGFKHLRGLRRHETSKRKKKEKAAQEQVDKQKEIVRLAAEAKALKDAIRKQALKDVADTAAELGKTVVSHVKDQRKKKVDEQKKRKGRKKPVRRSARHSRPRRSERRKMGKLAVTSFEESLEEFQEQYETAFTSMNPVNTRKPWLKAKHAAKRAATRHESVLAAMEHALHPPKHMHELDDYLLMDEIRSDKMAVEAAIIKMYHGVPYEKDRAPNLDVDNDFRTVRCMIGMPNAKKDAEDLLILKRDPGFLGIPIRDDYCARSFAAFKHGLVWNDKDRRVEELTEENADRLTPMNPRELMRSPHYKEWRKAMQVELDTLNDYKTFKFVMLDKSYKRITLKWVFKIKFKHGKFHKFKARLVARGFTQRPGLDYDPNGISAPVGRTSTFKCVTAEAVHKRWYLGEFDVKGAYLLAEVTEDVYAALPWGMERKKGTNSLKLNKSLYGLKQAGFNWNTKFTKVLESVGFKRSRIDPCLYVYCKGEDIIKIVLWVDDGLVSTNNKDLWHSIERDIDKITPMGSELGKDLDYLLGMGIFYNREKGILRFSQRSKVEALLERYGMDKCKPQALPMPYGEKLCADGPRTEEEKAEVAAICAKSGAGRIVTYDDVIRFCREVIGSVGYLACWARPDIRHAVYYLARYQANPSVRHFQLVKHMLRYLQGTRDLTLTFGTRHFEGDSPLVCLVDSNYIGEGDSCYSTSGYVYYYYGCPVLCESKKQTAISTGTTEAELIAASHAVKTGIYLRKLLIENFGMDPKVSTPIGEDNQGCIAISRGGGSHARTRHIRVADSYIYQEVCITGKFKMFYVRSHDNVSDIYTKPADLETFRRLRWYLMGDAPNDEIKGMKRNQHMTYHWLDENVGTAPAEECWRMSGDREVKGG